MGFWREIFDLRGKIPRRTNPLTESGLDLLEKLAGLDGITPNAVGAFGSVVFEVSSLRVKTLRDVKRTTRARLATHEVVGQKSVVEYLGTEPDEITFTMQLVADLGVDVQSELNELIDLLHSGEPQYLILGDHAHGQWKWYLTGLESKVEFTDRLGRPTVISVDVTMKEAVR